MYSSGFQAVVVNKRGFYKSSRVLINSLTRKVWLHFSSVLYVVIIVQHISDKRSVNSITMWNSIVITGIVMELTSE